MKGWLADTEVELLIADTKLRRRLAVILVYFNYRIPIIKDEDIYGFSVNLRGKMLLLNP